MSYNPDYPTDQGAGFLQHTYQPQQSDMFYWGGGMNPYGTMGMGFNDGSRRNTMNPVNPFAQFGQTPAQPQAVPEQAVQPFSSYPPSAPTAQPMGLNSMVESRRNIPAPQAPQNNPWATPQFQTPSQQTMAVFNSIPSQQQTATWFDPNCYGGPGYRVDMNTMSLYGNNTTGFDRHNSWENYYTQNRPLPMPIIDWKAQQSFNNPATMPQYSVQQFPTAQQSWKDIAEQNWAQQKL